MKAINQVARYGKKVANTASAKYAALGVALTTPMLAMADDTAIWSDAVTQLGDLKTGVIAVGSILLGITIAGAGFLVIRSYAKRA